MKTRMTMQSGITTKLSVTTVGALALALSIGFALVTTASAQDAGSPPPPPAQQGDAPPPPPPMGRPRMEQMQERQLAMMTRQLSLTPDQVTAVRAIDKDGMAQMMALRQDTTVEGPTKRQQMMKLRDDSRAKIRAVLTDDQKTKYDAMLERERERMEQRRGEQGGSASGGPGASGTPAPTPMNPPPPPQQ